LHKSGGRASRVGGSLAILAAAVLVSAAPSSAGAGPQTTTVPYGYTGAEQVFVVPDGINTIHVVAIGGSGADSTGRPGGIPGGLGGIGARVEGTLFVTPGQTLYVEVGGNGGDLNCVCNGGFNGGGDGAIDAPSANFGGGGGGGASDIRALPRAAGGSLDSRIIVAAGAGGGGHPGGTPGNGAGGAGGNGGADGGPGGASPTNSRGGGGGAGTGVGGTAGAGGEGGLAEDDGQPGDPGQLGVGGDGGPDPNNAPPGVGGGGGGGLFGGGGGGGGGFPASITTVAGGGGGGGGSSLVPQDGSATTPPDGTAPSITISYSFPGTELTKAPPKKVKTKRRKADVKFKFASDPEGLGFECSIDEAEYKVCDSPFAKRFKLGKHTFDVRSVDGATLNADQTPASSEFKVVKKR
jgi:hypothetical protein